MSMTKTERTILAIVFFIIVIGLAIGYAYWVVGQNARHILDTVVVPNPPRSKIKDKSPTIVIPRDFRDL